MSELKPCPFCGGEGERGRSRDGEYIGCFKCELHMPGGAAKWNRREMTIDALVATLEQIKTVCADNSTATCRHDLALKFVRDVAALALTRKGSAAIRQSKEPVED